MPLHGHPTDVLTADLVRLLELGRQRVAAAMETGLRRGLDPSRLGQPNQRRGDSTQAYRQRQLGQINAILAELRGQVRQRAALTVAAAYRSGLVALARTVGPGELTGEFGRVHIGAVQVLAGNLETSLNGAIAAMGTNAATVFARAGELEGALRPGGIGGLPRDFIGRRANDPYRTVGLEQVGAGIVGLETRRQVSAAIARRLVTDGVTDAVTGFVDRAGRRWAIDQYGAMVARTTTREAVSRATSNRMTESGLDLVTISEHAHPADECNEFEGNTYSLTGDTPGYEVLDELPPFHPNCVHVVTPATDNLEAYELELEAAAHEEAARMAPAARSSIPPPAPSEEDLVAATYNRPAGADVERLATPDVPAAPPFGVETDPTFDELTTMARLEDQRVAYAIAHAPPPDPGFLEPLEADTAGEGAAATERRRRVRALNKTMGPDLVRELKRKWAVEAGIRDRLLDGELTIEEAEQLAYEEYARAEGRRHQREGTRELNYGLEHRPIPCFHCGKLKRRPADVCDFCGDDPVPTSSGTSATGQERARFNADYGYAHIDTGRSYGSAAGYGRR